VYFSNIPYVIGYGFNKICICRMVTNSRRWIKIGAHFLSTLIKIDQKNVDIEIFCLKPFNHEIDCINNVVPSLLELTYFKLFLEGVYSKKLETLYKQGHIPQVLFENRPKFRFHLGKYPSNRYMGKWCISGDYRVPTCKDPWKHLGINPLDVL
jgi:hypothetical protein